MARRWRRKPGTTMDEVVKAVKRVTDIMGEISAASAEQSSGIEEINLAVTQMDAGTQQNAALVEQAAAAAQSLDDQARALKQMVGKFVLGASAGASGGVGSLWVGYAVSMRVGFHGTCFVFGLFALPLSGRAARSLRAKRVST